MISSISSAASAIKAAFTMMDVSANNTANMDTDGFKKDRISLGEAKGGGVVVNISKSNGPGLQYQGPDGKMIESSNVDYTQEVINQITAKNYALANMTVFKTSQDTEKHLLDIMA